MRCLGRLAAAFTVMLLGVCAEKRMVSADSSDQIIEGATR
jgi:hypothetical protein